MFTIRKSVLAACVMLSAITLHARAQDAAPTAAETVPPAVATTTVSDGFQKPLVTLEAPDGRKLVLFSNGENLPPLPEGYTRENAANGRVAYIAGQGQRTLIPYKVKSVITADAPYKVVASGIVNSRDALIEMPYHHNRVFRLTKDHITKSPLFHKEVNLAKAGTMGFYAGTFNGGMAAGNTMFCYFPVADVIKYASPSCGLGVPGHTEMSFQPVATYGNLPTYYTVTTMYGTPITNYIEGFASEITIDKIPYDFKLVLRFIKRTDKGVVLNWDSDGVRVDEEVVPLNANGQAVIDFAEGRLALTPDAKNKKAATFSWTPKEDSPAQTPATPER